MRLGRLKQNWHEFGVKDPLWAVATADQYRGGRWESDEFFATGRAQVDAVLQAASELGGAMTGDALDFGCGVGRLSQALASHFDRVVGVDIAPSMIDRAREFDSDARCEFVLNDRPDLAQFADDSFRFVYSEITLMHMRPAYSLAYVREFLRVCTEGGMVVFQVPEVTAKQRLRDHVPEPIWEVATRIRTWRHPRMEIYGIDRQVIESVVSQAGGRVLLTEMVAPAPSIKADNFRYFVAPCVEP